MNDTLIDQGLSLMLFGMGTVFVFLTILVFATTLMSKVVSRFAAEPAPVEPAPKSAPQTAASPQVLSAIKLAIAEHRKR